MEYKKKYTKPNKSNYNQFIEEAGIKEEIEKENKKNLSEKLKPKKKEGTEKQINLIEESNNDKTNNRLIGTDKINNNKEIKYDNGEIYIGDILKGLKHGKGIMYYNRKGENEIMRYEGDFKNDIKEGKGIYYYNNGDRYEGDFKNDLQEGKGIYYYNNGDRYEGDLKMV